MSFHFFFANKGDFLLDKIPSIVAISTSRKLSSNASYAMRIRRASDDAELDVGFAGNSIDNKAIKNFGGKNLWSYTNNFSNSVWIKHSGVFVTQTNNIAPTGENSWEINFTNGVFIFQFVKQNISSVQNVVFSAYVRGVTGESINISITNSTNTISNPHTFNGDWQRVNITADFQTDLNGNIDSLRGAIGKRSLASGFFEAASWQFEIESTPTSYQSRSAGGASDCFVTKWYDQSGKGNDANQTVVTNQPKIYDVATGEVTKENGKPAMVFDGVDDNLIISNVAGRSNIDAYFVNKHDDTSATSVNVNKYLYFNGTVGSKYGFVGEVNGTNVLYNNYGTPNLYKNNTLLSPTNRGEVYSLLGQTQNIVNHQGANISTWASCNFGNHPVGEGNWNFEGTVQEVIIFDKNLTTKERTLLHSDINNHFNIY